MPSLTNHDDDFYCYACKCTILFKTQARISCKIKQDNGDEYDGVLCDP